MVGIQDHPYNSGFMDTLTLITFLTARATRIRFFPNVANLPLRQPAMLAKAIATLYILTGGRVELGLGAGAFWKGVVAYGGSQKLPKEALLSLEEAIKVIRLI